MLIDTHAHLYLQHFEKDTDMIFERALKNNVKKIFLPNIDSSTIPSLYNLVEAYPSICSPMMGVHPCSIKANYKEELNTALIELQKFPKKFCAIGEIGLDFYWDTTYKLEQMEALQVQIGWAKQYKLPIVLHCRNSFEETYDIVKAFNDDDLTGIFHCFTGSVEEAQKVMDLGGFYMGIGGVVTYKNSGLDKMLPSVPLEYLVLETDAPYLTPDPHRKQQKKNRRNESAFIPIIAEKIAAIKQVSLTEVTEKTTANSRKIFGERFFYT